MGSKGGQSGGEGGKNKCSNEPRKPQLAGVALPASIYASQSCNGDGPDVNQTSSFDLNKCRLQTSMNYELRSLLKIPALLEFPRGDIVGLARKSNGNLALALLQPPQCCQYPTGLFRH